ncbi:MAG: transposase [Deltaproteobacteria bacterium]|jgi:hypothetical protein|nr:transposase [Deltaproteobacteria bacterium]
MGDNANETENTGAQPSVVDSLLPGHIFYEERESATYARYVKSTYTKNGKVYHEYENLGRVIDERLGIFKNRKRGYFTFNMHSGYGDVDPQTNFAAYDKERLEYLNFGDAWLIDQLLKQLELGNILDNLCPHHVNTLKSLVCFRVAEHHSFDKAKDWYRKSYARILYPGAKLDSSSISKLHALIGREENYKKFFELYFDRLKLIKNARGQKSFPILIDSTGLPNGIKTYLTTCNNHNSVVSNEIRLIYVVDKDTKLPIFYRYICGNIIDNTTLINTINSLLQHKIDINLVIIDAGYSSSKNLKQLISSKIPFVTRLPHNRKEYKLLMENYGNNLELHENAVNFNDRTLYGQKVTVDIEGKKLYAYVMVDIKKKCDEQIRIERKYDDESDENINKKLQSAGKFILLSYDEYDTKEIIPLYYNRAIIEQVFDISNNFADLLPLGPHSEETIRGRLLIIFIATIISTYVSNELVGSKYSTSNAFYKMHHLGIKLYETAAIVEELTKEQNDILGHLKIVCDFPQERGNLLKKDSYLDKVKNEIKRKGRGRPKGSKNKDKTGVQAKTFFDSSVPPNRGRGRHKGSKD